MLKKRQGVIKVSVLMLILNLVMLSISGQRVYATTYITEDESVEDMVNSNEAMVDNEANSIEVLVENEEESSDNEESEVSSGYKPEVIEEELAIDSEECDLPDGCELLGTVETTTSQVDLNATIENTEEGMRNVEYVKNEDNAAHDHDNQDYEAIYGPADLEFNHWDSDYAGKYFETYRVNFGSEQAINQSKLTVTLPYETSLQELHEQGLLSISNASTWLVERLFRNESNYDEAMTDIPDFIFNHNQIIFDLGDVKARSALSLQVERIFNTQAEYETLRQGTAHANVSGEFNFDYVDLPGEREKIIYHNYQGDLNDLLPVDDSFNSPTEIGATSTYEVLEEITRDEANGYISNKKTTYRVTAVKEIIDENGHKVLCYDIEKIVEYLPSFKFIGESVMDTDLEDYPNNGFLIEVKNPNNHDSEISQDLYGPGNLTVQHWQTGPNEATTQQNWRIVFATDYAIENGKLQVTLPYDIDLSDITNVTNWLTTRYYPAVTDEEEHYSDLTELLNIDLQSHVEIIENILTMDFSNIIIPARTTLGFTISKLFEEAQDFSAEPNVVTAILEGDWYFNNIELPGERKTVTIACEECEVPVVEEPEEPTNPEEKPVVTDPNKGKSEGVPVIVEVPQETVKGQQDVETTIAFASRPESGNVATLPETGESRDFLFHSVATLTLLLGSVLLVVSQKLKD